MVVFVINKHGEPLMPCSQRKARLLLRGGKAKIENYNPFTIQLLYGSSGYKQNTNIGIDTGAKYIGVAVTSQDKVLHLSVKKKNKLKSNCREKMYKSIENKRILVYNG